MSALVVCRCRGRMMAHTASIRSSRTRSNSTSTSGTLSTATATVCHLRLPLRPLLTHRLQRRRQICQARPVPRHRHRLTHPCVNTACTTWTLRWRSSPPTTWVGLGPRQVPQRYAFRTSARPTGILLIWFLRTRLSTTAGRGGTVENPAEISGQAILALLMFRAQRQLRFLPDLSETGRTSRLSCLNRSSGPFTTLTRALGAARRCASAPISTSQDQRSNFPAEKSTSLETARGSQFFAQMSKAFFGMIR